MSIFNKTLTIDFGNSSDIPEIKLVQGEEAARVIHLKLSDGNTAVNLTGCTARIYILPYGETTPLYEDLTVISAASGKADYMVSGNAAAIAGAGKFWIEIIQTGSPDPLSVGYSKEGKLTVTAKQDFTGAITASTVFSALTTALSTVQTYLSRIVALETGQGSGWIPVTESLTYASAYTISVPAGAGTRWQKDDKIKFIQHGVTKYGYITAVTDTLLTFCAGSLYTLENTTTYPITNVYLSRAENPYGFPTSFPFTIASWSTDGTAFTNAPGVPYAYFSISGGQAHLRLLCVSNANSGGTGTFIATPTANQLPLAAFAVSGSCVSFSNVFGFAWIYNGSIRLAKYDGAAIVGNSNYFAISIDYFY